MNKKGVTLLTVVMSILILSIIAGTIVFSGSMLVGKTNLTKFAEELSFIEDKMEEYYAINGTYPVILENSYSAEEVVELNKSGHSLELTEEIEKNNDEVSTFYLIDYNKVGIELLERGIEETPEDIYVVAKETNTVYYIKGVEIENEIYFSLAKIVDVVKIN